MYLYTTFYLKFINLFIAQNRMHKLKIMFEDREVKRFVSNSILLLT